MTYYISGQCGPVDCAPGAVGGGGGGGSCSALPVEGREVATDTPLDWTGQAAGLT